MPNPSPQLITLISTDTVAARLGVTREHVNYLVRSKREGFPAPRKIGRQNFYDPAAIDAFKANDAWNKRGVATITVSADWHPSNEGVA